jgi:hypothetical protein
MWPFNGFPMSEKSLSITRLAVHLPEQHQATFQEGREEAAVQQ